MINQTSICAEVGERIEGLVEVGSPNRIGRWVTGHSPGERKRH